MLRTDHRKSNNDGHRIGQDALDKKDSLNLTRSCLIIYGILKENYGDILFGGKGVNEKLRCAWAGDTPIYTDYHDNEWGRPVHNDDKLFEMLILETMQAGLSWITVLKKRDAFRAAFDGFDPQKMALYDDEKMEELMGNDGIIRNRLKIYAAINNAKVFLAVKDQYGSFDKMIWSYVDNSPIVGHWKTIENFPATTPLSDKISKDLKRMGFKFVGSTTIYAFMQAVGMVNDHLSECFVYSEMIKNKPVDK